MVIAKLLRVMTSVPKGVLASGILVAAMTIAHAQSDRMTVVMGYESFPPYSFTDESGLASGLSIDLMREIVEPLGYELRFVEAHNPAELLDMLRQGQIDATSLLANTPARRELGQFTLPLGEFSSSLFVQSGSDFRTKYDLSGKRIGVVAGSFAGVAAGQVPFAEIVELEDQDAVMVALLSGTVDAIASSTETFQKALRTLDVERNVHLISPPLMSSPRGFLTGPSAQGLADDLNRSIAQNISPANLNLLYDHWFGAPIPFVGSRNFWLMVSGLVIIVGALIYATYLRRGMRLSQARLREKNLIVEALNCSDLALGILDENLKFVFWNENLGRLFPESAPFIKRGVSLADLTAVTQNLGARLEFATPRDADHANNPAPEHIQSGDDRRRRIHLPNGRILEAFERPFGDNMFITMQRDITASWEHLQTIDKQRDLLKAQNKKLRDFGSVVAHDLRTPISSQVSVMEMLRSELNQGPATVSPHLGACVNKSADTLNNMVGMIDDLLNDAVIAGTDLDSSAFNTEDRIPRCVALAGLPETFEIEVSGDFPSVDLVVTEFDTVLRNLISNAGKHHDRDDGKITITGAVTDTCATITVEDDGPGIPVDQIDQVFERGIRSAHEDSGGVGLGLAFVKELVEKWGGSVEISPGALGGATFRVTLPATLYSTDPTDGEDKVVPLSAAG